MEHISLADYALRLLTQDVDEEFDYFFFTLLGKEDGELEWATYSEWTGWADEEHRIELRKASIIRAGKVVNSFREIEDGCAVINTIEDMEVYLLIGGHGVVEEDVASKVVPEMLAPSPSVQVGKYGFYHPESLSKNAFNKAPTKKQRMRVIMRDSYKCRVCGRRPTDYTDIELHVHHIKPWAGRGVTDDRNLITLCSTCHNGLDPHYSPALFNLFEPQSEERRMIRSDQYWQGVKRFRENISREYEATNRE